MTGQQPEWQPLKTLPANDEAQIVVLLGPDSNAPGCIIDCKRGRLSDRPGPQHLRLRAIAWMPRPAQPAWWGKS